MPRYDKYEPIAGGFRAPLAADLPFNANGEFGPKVVSLDANGRVVVGTGGAAGPCGVVVKNVPKYPGLGNIPGQINSAVPIGGKAGDIVDVMTHGEIVGLTAFPAGTRYYGAANGDVNVTPSGVLVGRTVQAGRLVVRFQELPTA